MRVNSTGGKTVLEKPDGEAIDRVTHLTRAIAFHFGPGSVSRDDTLAKASEDAHKAMAVLAPLVAKRIEEDTKKKKQEPAAPAPAAAAGTKK